MYFLFICMQRVCLGSCYVLLRNSAVSNLSLVSAKDTELMSSFVCFALNGG